MNTQPPTSTSTLPYDWLKEIPSALLMLDDIPLLGFIPPFPWEDFSSKLAAVFKLENLNIQSIETKWRTSEELLTGLGGSPTPYHISIPGLEGDLCLILAERDIALLASILITTGKEPLDVIDPDFEKGFMHFLAYEIFEVFNQVNYDKTVNPHLLEREDLPKEPSLCMDISTLINGAVLIARLIISPEFRKAWKEKHATRTLDIPHNKALAEKIQLPVHIEAGKTFLTLSEWNTLSLGDFLILDQCSMDPTADIQRVMLTINGMPFFRAKIKEGNLKILEHPLYYEADTTMAKFKPEDEESSVDDEHEESELDYSDDESFEFEETEAGTETEPESAVEESELDETHEEHEDDSSTAHENEESHHERAPAENAPKRQAPESESHKLESIPLSIVVEVGRLQISMQKLMELQPGNLLELDLKPENGVDLTVNGKRIGKGELMKIGEALGVRILDIA